MYVVAVTFDVTEAGLGWAWLECVQAPSDGFAGIWGGYTWAKTGEYSSWKEVEDEVDYLLSKTEVTKQKKNEMLHLRPVAYDVVWEKGTWKRTE